MPPPVRPPWLLPRLYSFWDERDDLRILRATIQGEAAGEGIETGRESRLGALAIAHGEE